MYIRLTRRDLSARRLRATLPVVVVTLILFLAGCSEDPVQELLSQAEEAARSGDLHAATVYYGTVVSKDPRHAFSRWKLANVLLDLGEGAAAEEHVHAAARLGIDNGRVRPALAEVLFLQGRHPEVLVLSVDGLADTPAAIVMAFQSRSSLALGRSREAEALATRALKLSRYSADALFADAVLAVSRGDHEAATEALNRLDAVEAGYPYTIALRAEIARVQGDIALSRRILEQVANPAFASWRGPGAAEPTSAAAVVIEADTAAPGPVEVDPERMESERMEPGGFGMVDTSSISSSADRVEPSAPERPSAAEIAARHPVGGDGTDTIQGQLPVAEPTVSGAATGEIEDGVGASPAQTAPLVVATVAAPEISDTAEVPDEAAGPGRSGQAPGSESASILEPEAPVQSVEQFVRAWAADWSRQDVAAYLSRYAADFRPASGLDRGLWAAQRRLRLARPSSIDVQVTAFEVHAEGNLQVRASFDQAYRANHYRDNVRKTLLLRRANAGWEILGEFGETLPQDQLPVSAEVVER